MCSKNLQFWLLFLLSCLSIQHLNAQCSACTIIVSGQDNNNYVIGPTEKLCILSTGVYKGTTLELDGGEMCNMGIARPKIMIITEGIINNSGSITTGQLHMKNTNSIINNQGTINVRMLFLMTGGVVNNNNTINITNTFDFDGDMFYNHGTLKVQNSIRVNALMDNSPTGYIEVGASMTINTPGILKNSSCVKVTNDFTNNSVVEGAVSGCGSFETNGISRNLGIFGQVGNIDFCDNGAPLGGFDQISGLVGPAVTHCTCGTGPCFKTGSFFPVELTHFNIMTTKQRTNILNWQTSSETNNDYFTVERSSDAIHFDPVSQLQGAGTTTEVQNYTWTDNNCLSGTSYYRLKQTDFDGSFTYSEIKSVYLEPIAEPIVFPNPTDGILHIALANKNQEKAMVRVYDELGNCIKSIRSNENNLKIDLSDYPAGIYFTQIVSEEDGHNLIYKKIIKR